AHGTGVFRGGTRRLISKVGARRWPASGDSRYRPPLMRISLFLPHVGVFGGVRRFLELGNAWVDAGHEVDLYHPGGAAPGWLPFRGSTRPLDAAGGARAALAWCADSA